MEISMSLEPHGWLDVVINSKDGEEIEIPVSFLTDAIYDIANKVSILNNEVNEVIISVQTEPGEYRFRIIKVSNTLSLFEVFEMNDNFSSEMLEEGTLLITEEIKTIRLLRIIHRELTKMKGLGAEEYKKRWNSDFPISAYERITDSILRLKQFEVNSE